MTSIITKQTNAPLVGVKRQLAERLKEIEMNQKNAVEILNYFGKERDQAHRSNMDWVPSLETESEMGKAFSVISKSNKCASELLNKAGLSLFEKMDTE